MPNLALLATCCVRLEPGPLPSTGVTRLQRYYGPIRHPMTPGPSVTGVRFGRPRPRHRVSRVACAFLVYMLPPLPRRGDGRSHCAHPFRRVSLPRNGSRVGPRIDRFEACSAFTRVAACTLALPPTWLALPEGFSQFVTSLAAPVLPAGAFAGWASHPLESAALARRTPTAVGRSAGETSDDVPDTARAPAWIPRSPRTGSHALSRVPRFHSIPARANAM